MWFFLLFGGLAIDHTKLRRYPEPKSVKFKQRIAYFKQMGMLCENYPGGVLSVSLLVGILVSCIYPII